MILQVGWCSFTSNLNSCIIHQEGYMPMPVHTCPIPFHLHTSIWSRWGSCAYIQTKEVFRSLQETNTKGILLLTIYALLSVYLTKHSVPDSKNECFTGNFTTQEDLAVAEQCSRFLLFFCLLTSKVTLGLLLGLTTNRRKDQMKDHDQFKAERFGVKGSWYHWFCLLGLPWHWYMLIDTHYSAQATSKNEQQVQMLEACSVCTSQ